MNNIFEISGDEIKRILSLHEESTKQQYLNVLNEQSKDTYVTTQDHSSYMFIPKGSKFSKGENGVLTTFTNGFTMYYNCNGKFYIVKGYNQKQYDAGLTKELANFCLSQRSIGTSTGEFTTDKEYVLTSDGDKITIPSKNTFRITTPNYVIGPKVGDIGNLGYFCDTKIFMFQNDPKKRRFYGPTLYPKLDKICYTKKGGEVSQPQQTTTQKPVVKPTTTKKPVTKQTPQQFAQQVKTYNTQIQTSLGSQKPTGQITDADLDNILTKLG